MTTFPHIITLNKDIHRNQNVIRMQPAANKHIAKKTTAVKWSQTMGCWYLAEDDLKLAGFIKLFGDIATIDGIISNK